MIVGSMQGNNSQDKISGKIYDNSGILSGRINPTFGGGGSSELPDINIFKYGDYNWIGGITHHETHQNKRNNTVYSTSPLYEIQSGNMHFTGNARGNMRSALVIPFLKKTKNKIKIRATVSNIGTYNSFGACVASGIDPAVYKTWVVNVSSQRLGLINPTSLVWMTFFNDESKNIEVDNGIIELPFSGITDDTLVLFLYQCDNTVDIHSIWFE